MQSAAAESFVGGVDSPIDDVVSNQTLEWTQRAGSTVVDNVAGEFEEVDCY